MSRAKVVHWMPMVMEALRALGGSARPAEVVQWVHENGDVPPEDLDRTVSTGQSIFENQIHWCRNYFREAGLIDSTKRGVWTLTDLGRAETIDRDRATEIYREVARKKSDRKKLQSGDSVDGTGSSDSDDEAVDDPDSREFDYREDVLQILKNLSATGFERFCQRLLREAGFTSVEITGQSGDGGIDGRGRLRVNSLVSFSVCFQCKKYQDPVGSPKVRDFRGAIVGRADRGMLITTASFTHDARKEAQRDGGMPIELIDGNAIVDILEEFELGLQPRKTFEIDYHWFDDFAD